MKARPTQRLVLLFLRAYQSFLSPVFSGACRFYPSCSAYAVEAVERHGARQGLWLAVRRLLRCHPLQRGPADGGAGGYDPVPIDLGQARLLRRGDQASHACAGRLDGQV